MAGQKHLLPLRQLTLGLRLGPPEGGPRPNRPKDGWAWVRRCGGSEGIDEGTEVEGRFGGPER